MQAFHHQVEIGNKQGAYEGGHQHTGKNGDTERDPARSSGSGRNHQRESAEDESKRGHQDRAETYASAFDRRFFGRLACSPVIPGEFYDQDSIFRRQGNQKHYSDLGVNADRKIHDHHSDHYSQQGDRQTHDHCKRIRPALVLGCQDQESHHDGQYKDDGGGRTRIFFLICHRSPFITEGASHFLPDQFGHNIQRLSRAITVCCGTRDQGGYVSVVFRQALCADPRLDSSKGRKGNHVALGVADIQ